MDNELRKNIKKMMVDLGLDNRTGGGYRGLLPRLSERTGRPISAQMLSNAITGYQSGKPAQELLAAVKEILDTWPAQTT
jgi:hypothetical protein